MKNKRRSPYSCTFLPKRLSLNVHTRLLGLLLGGLCFLPNTLWAQTPDLVYNGDLILYRSEEVDTYKNVVRIEGDLVFAPAFPPSTSLSAMRLQVVTGNVSISYSPSFDGFSVDDLPQLDSIKGDFIIRGNQNINYLRGFASLAYIGGDFEITDNQGFLWLPMEAAPADEFAALSVVDGRMILRNNAPSTKESLRNKPLILPSFAAITNIADSLVIDANSHLQAINGFQALERTGIINITNNQSLTTLEDFASLGMGGASNFLLRNNPFLAGCCSKLRFLGTIPATRILQGNAPSCNDGLDMSGNPARFMFNSCAEIALESATFTLNPSGGALTIDLSSNASWAVSPAYLSGVSEWITSISPETGMGDEEITLNYPANPGLVSRVVLIQAEALQTDGSRFSPRRFTRLRYTQAGADASLALTIPSVSAGTPPIAAVPKTGGGFQTPILPAAGGTYPVSLAVNVAWKASVQATGAAWLTPLPLTGTTDQMITLTYKANPSISAREATLVVSGDGISTKLIISQAAGETVFEITPPESLELPAAGGAFNFAANSNIPYRIDVRYPMGTLPWVLSNTGIAGQAFAPAATFRAPNNQRAYPRTATILFTNGRGTTYGPYEISQAPSAPSFATRPQFSLFSPFDTNHTFRLPQEKGRFNRELVTSVRWRIREEYPEGQDPWFLQISPNAETEGTVIRTEYDANPQAGTRQATLVIEALSQDGTMPYDPPFSLELVFIQQGLGSVLSTPNASNHAPNRPTLRLAPNPAQHRLSIQTPEPAQVRIYTLVGIQVASYNTQAHDTMDISALPQGLYVLHAQTQTQVYTQRFLKSAPNRGF